LTLYPQVFGKKSLDASHRESKVSPSALFCSLESDELGDRARETLASLLTRRVMPGWEADLRDGEIGKSILTLLAEPYYIPLQSQVSAPATRLGIGSIMTLQGYSSMRKTSWLTLCVTLTVGTLTGCNRSGEQTASTQAPAAEKIDSAAAAKDAADTVTQFLDALRRGGSDDAAASLLTSAARQECQRKGIAIQPIGSPNAHFEVTRGELVPGRTDASLVHSMWTEPGADANKQAFEIVWALKRETVNSGWKISGMIVDAGNGEPTAVDFENGDDLLSQLTGSKPAAETAAVPAQSAPR
jgi:hypothetical protein